MTVNVYQSATAGTFTDTVVLRREPTLSIKGRLQSGDRHGLDLQRPLLPPPAGMDEVHSELDDPQGEMGTPGSSKVRENPSLTETDRASHQRSMLSFPVVWESSTPIPG